MNFETGSSIMSGLELATRLIPFTSILAMLTDLAKGTMKRALGQDLSHQQEQRLEQVAGDECKSGYADWKRFVLLNIEGCDHEDNAAEKPHTKTCQLKGISKRGMAQPGTGHKTKR